MRGLWPEVCQQAPARDSQRDGPPEGEAVCVSALWQRLSRQASSSQSHALQASQGAEVCLLRVLRRGKGFFCVFKFMDFCKSLRVFI